MTGGTTTGTSRRRFLITSAAAVALAGCSGGGGTGDGDGGAATLDGADYPEVDAWMRGTTDNFTDDSYDGTILDLRGEATVRVAVGETGNGGDFAYDPAAIAVDPGTTVRWVWTGRGGAHNVEAEAEGGSTATDYEFKSGEPIEAAGTEFAFTFEEPGVALYHCEPHLSLGMKGAVLVR